MRTATARFDRRVTILQQATVRDETFGTDTPRWLPLATVWAEVLATLPGRSEAIAEGVDQGRRSCRVRLRWRGDVTGAMRLEIGGDEYRIVSGPVEVGRREELELIAEHVTTEGERP